MKHSENLGRNECKINPSQFLIEIVLLPTHITHNYVYVQCDDKPSDLYPNCDGSIWLRSCEEEIAEPITGQVIGTIPKWIKGSLLRNGPGRLKVGDMMFKHLFDSSALIHRQIIMMVVSNSISEMLLLKI